MSLEPPSDAEEPADEPAKPSADDTAPQPAASSKPRPGAKPGRAKPAQKQAGKPAPRHAAPPRGNGKQLPPAQPGASFPADLRLPRDQPEAPGAQSRTEPPAGTQDGPGYWMPPPPDAAADVESPTEALPVAAAEPADGGPGAVAQPADEQATDEVAQPPEPTAAPAPADRGESGFDVNEVKEQVGEPQTTSLLPPRPAARRPGWAPVAVLALLVLLRRRRRRRRAARG
jgi:hypothetical protein